MLALEACTNENSDGSNPASNNSAGTNPLGQGSLFDNLFGQGLTGWFAGFGVAVGGPIGGILGGVFGKGVGWLSNQPHRHYACSCEPHDDLCIDIGKNNPECGNGPDAGVPDANTSDPSLQDPGLPAGGPDAGCTDDANPGDSGSGDSSGDDCTEGDAGAGGERIVYVVEADTSEDDTGFDDGTTWGDPTFGSDPSPGGEGGRDDAVGGDTGGEGDPHSDGSSSEGSTDNGDSTPDDSSQGDIDPDTSTEDNNETGDGACGGAATDFTVGDGSDRGVTGAANFLQSLMRVQPQKTTFRQFCEVVGGTDPTSLRNASLIRPHPTDNAGVLAAPGGAGLVGIPGPGYSEARPEDIGVGRRRVVRAPYSAIHPRQDYVDPGPERSPARLRR
jgi:hypothetical protein